MKCNCELKPEHDELEHDWCCQICGGSHTEEICPITRKVDLRKFKQQLVEKRRKVNNG